MSIHFISGKPGGGKTLYSVRLIVDELVKGSRLVVTNVAIKIPELLVFLQERYPKEYQDKFVTPGVHITDRIHLITEEELSKFFTFRGAGVRLRSVSNDEWKRGLRPDFSQVVDSGVLYVLDEVHIAFNARAWAETGAEVLYYLSQHRKLGDDVVCITQSIGNVDKQFRSVAQDFTYIKNLSKQKAGIFRLPAVFTRNTYAQPATETSKPMETGTFTLDVSGLASCYDTARGVGIHGRTGADTNARKKGVHWVVAVVGVPVIIYLLVTYLPQIVSAGLKPKGTTPPPRHQGVVVPGPVGPGHVPPGVPGNRPPFPALPSSSQGGTNEIFCKGYAVLFGRPTVYLSDGSIYDSESTPGAITKVTPTRVVVNGREYKVKPGTNVSAPESRNYQAASSFPRPGGSLLPTVNQSPRIVDFRDSGPYQAELLNSHQRDEVP